MLASMHKNHCNIDLLKNKKIKYKDYKLIKIR